jgi:hypothetical protein
MRLFMAKSLSNSNPVKAPEDLVTSRVDTKAGFIMMALEKNEIAKPYIEQAKSLKVLASKVRKPKDLLKVKELRNGLLTASGLSEKSLKFLEENDKTKAIELLIEKFLEPAGESFADELVYRYLLTKGDALGGQARNLAGTLGERRFIRTLLSVFTITGVKFQWRDRQTKSWLEGGDNDEGIEKRIDGIYWAVSGKNRLLLFNITVPVVGKNVDLIILDSKPSDIKNGAKELIKENGRYVALGELKGGIDPAGADEHWKTANSALNRIRKAFLTKSMKPPTFFVGAAIEKSMAVEIFEDLNNGVLNRAANLTKDSQLTSVCNWLVNL